MTREQIASILYRYAKLKGWDVSKTANLQDFADGTDTSAWATRAMEWAYAEKIGKEIVMAEQGWIEEYLERVETVPGIE